MCKEEWSKSLDKALRNVRAGIKSPNTIIRMNPNGQTEVGVVYRGKEIVAPIKLSK